MTEPLQIYTDGILKPNGELARVTSSGSATSRLHLPELVPGQSLKYVTYNEALSRLDPIIQLTVSRRQFQFLPDAPTADIEDGDIRIISSEPDGQLSDYAEALACWSAAENHWRLIRPQEGWTA